MGITFQNNGTAALYPCTADLLCHWTHLSIEGTGPWNLALAPGSLHESIMCWFFIETHHIFSLLLTHCPESLFTSSCSSHQQCQSFSSTFMCTQQLLLCLELLISSNIIDVQRHPLPSHTIDCHTCLLSSGYSSAYLSRILTSEGEFYSSHSFQTIFCHTNAPITFYAFLIHAIISHPYNSPFQSHFSESLSNA